MSGATEIYICQPGQALKEGRVEYGTMDTKDEAASDAERRCRQDPSIARIAYYAVTEDGNFRNLFVYENPNAGKPKPRRALGGDGSARRGRRRVAKRKPTIIERVCSVLMED
jgi:hypothetical protein